jgi:hypothetical protein
MFKFSYKKKTIKSVAVDLIGKKVLKFLHPQASRMHAQSSFNFEDVVPSSVHCKQSHDNSSCSSWCWGWLGQSSLMGNSLMGRPGLKEQG